MLNRRRVLNRWRMLRLPGSSLSIQCKSRHNRIVSPARRYLRPCLLTAKWEHVVPTYTQRCHRLHNDTKPCVAFRKFMSSTYVSVQKQMMRRHFMAKTQCKDHGPSPNTYFLIKNNVLSCLRSGRRAIADSTIAITITIAPCPPDTTQNVEDVQEPWKVRQKIRSNPCRSCRKLLT